MNELDRLTDDSFEQTVTGSDVPVLVFFTAAWSRPDQACLPFLQQLKDEYDGRMLFCAINVDENPKTAAKFGIKGVPTFLILRKSVSIEVGAQQVGASPKSKLQALIDPFVS